MGSPPDPRGITSVRRLPLVKGNSLKKMAADDNETWLWNCDDPDKSLRFAGGV